MVVEIFITAGDPDDSLGQHRLLPMKGQGRMTGIGNDVGHGLGQTDPPVHLPKQQRPGVAGDLPAVKISLNFL